MKKLFSVLMAAALLLGCISGAAWADDDAPRMTVSTEAAKTGEPRGLLFPQKWRHLWSRLGK